MTPSIVVTGLGVVSPIGVGAAAFFDALADGRSAVAGGEARVGDFGAKTHIAAASLRRMPRLTQMALVAARQALAEADTAALDSARVGVVLGTGLGTLDETIQFMRGYLEGGPEAASPMIFPYSVMNAAAGQIAVECKLRGVNSTVNHRDSSPLAALVMACDLLALGRADALLVGGVDGLCQPARDGYAAFGACTRTSMRPYDRARDGLALGEGAAVLVLERETDARARGARVVARVSGWGESSDDRPRIGWHGAFTEAPRAVAAAVGGRRVDWMAGGGNGTALDVEELGAVQAALGALPPTSSILGQVGESLSSAALRLAAALFALERQRLPGTVGLDTPASFADQLVRAPRAATVENVLVPSFAQGGANLAVLLSSP